MNPNLDIIVRTRTLNERDAVRAHGIQEIVTSDVELALTMTRRSIVLLGSRKNLGARRSASSGTTSRLSTTSDPS